MCRTEGGLLPTLGMIYTPLVLREVFWNYIQVREGCALCQPWDSNSFPLDVCKFPSVRMLCDGLSVTVIPGISSLESHIG